MTTITADTLPDPQQTRRGRRTALLLFAVGFGPMILATVMYFTGWLNPTGHTNEGNLVQPLVPVQGLHLQDADGQPFADRFAAGVDDPQWQMLVAAETCAAECEELLYLARQVNVALGKNAPRVSRAAWLGSVPAPLEERLQQEYPAIEQLQVAPGERAGWPADFSPGRQPGLFLVDPFGNVMMHYGPDHTGKQILTDLKHLLKLSQVG